jgi:hypothetical protein
MSPKLVGGEVVVFASDAMALGRFGAAGAIGYVAKTAPNAAVRLSREQAMEDERAHFEVKWAGELSNDC